MRVKEESEKAGLKLYMQKTKIMASGPIILWQIDGEKVEAVTDLFTWSQKSLWMVTAALWKESYDKLRQHIKKQRHHFPDRGLYSQKYGFSFSHVWMWELDHKEDREPKNWCFWIVVLGKTLASPLDCNEIKPVNPKGDQPWIFIGRTDAKAEAPVLWQPDEKSLVIGKDPDDGKDWMQKEKGMAEDEMVRKHHQLNGNEFEQTPRDSEWQGSPWSGKESAAEQQQQRELEVCFLSFMSKFILLTYKFLNSYKK